MEKLEAWLMLLQQRAREDPVRLRMRAQPTSARWIVAGRGREGRRAGRVRSAERESDRSHPRRGDEAPRRGARRLQNLTWQNMLDCETNGGEFAKQSTVSPGAALRGGRRARGPPRIHARISIDRAEATTAGRSRRLGTTTPSVSTRRAVQRLVAGRDQRAGPLIPERAICPEPQRTGSSHA